MVMIDRIKTMLKADKTKVILDQAIFSGTSFITMLILARALGLYEFGIFASVQLYTFLLMSISGAFVIQPMQVLYGKSMDKSAYIASTIFIQSGSAILMAIVMLLAYLIAVLLGFSWASILIPAGAFGIVTIFYDYVRKRLLVEDRPDQLIIIDALMSFVQVVIAVLTYFFHLDVDHVLGLISLGLIPGIMYGVALMSDNFNLLDIRKYTFEHMTQARWLAPTAMVQWMTSNFFVASSGLYLGVAALGAFRLVQTLFGLINILLQGLESYILPQAAIRFQRSTDEAYLYLKNLTKRAILPMSIILGLMFVFADYIIIWAGGDAYMEYGFVIRWMVILYVFILVNYPVRILIRLHEMNHLFLVGYILSFVFSLISAHYLLSNHQLIGAIIGLGINQIILFAIWQYSLNKKEISLWKSFI